MHRTEQQRIAVRRCLGHRIGTDRATRAAAVINDDLLTELGRELDGQWSGERISATTSGKRHHQAHGANRPLLCVGRARNKEQCADGHQRSTPYERSYRR